MKTAALTIILILHLSSAFAVENDCPPSPADFPEIARFYEDIAATGAILKEVKVGIIDSGAEASHPSLSGKILQNEGTSFIQNKDFVGNTELTRRVRELRLKNNKSSTELSELTQKETELQAKRNKSQTEIEALRVKLAACNQDDCTNKVQSQIAATEREFSKVLNPDWNPYGSNPLKQYNETGAGFSEHGTFISGIVAGKRNSPGSEFNGIAENARLIIVKVTNSPDESEMDEQVAAGIRYATDRDAKIINISLGKYESTKPELVSLAFDYAKSRNVVIVLSAGNSGKNLDEVKHYPLPNRDHTNVFIVGSNTKNTNYNGRVDFHVAEGNTKGPKEDEAYYKSSSLNGKTSTKKGSSMSAAYATGVFALALGINPNLSPDNLRNLVQDNVVPMEAETGKRMNQIKSYELLWKVLEDKTRQGPVQ